MFVMFDHVCDNLSKFKNPTCLSIVLFLPKITIWHAFTVYLLDMSCIIRNLNTWPNRKKNCVLGTK